MNTEYREPPPRGVNKLAVVVFGWRLIGGVVACVVGGAW